MQTHIDIDSMPFLGGLEACVGSTGRCWWWVREACEVGVAVVSGEREMNEE